MEGGTLYMNSLTKIKNDIESILDEKVMLKANKGRKRTVVKEGIVESVYPSLFVVKVSNEYDSVRRVSYTYTDVLTGTVELSLVSRNEEVKIS